MPTVKQFDTDEVLEKAMELFWEKGYNGTSINDLVEATGLSRSSLYATYQDKHRLFMTALKRYQELNDTALADRLKDVSTAKGKIEMVFRSTLQAILKEPFGKGCFMVNTAAEMANQDAGIARVASEDFGGMEALFVSLLKQGQAAGEISKETRVKPMAQYLFSSYLGLRIMGQTQPDKVRLENIIALALSIVK